MGRYEHIEGSHEQHLGLTWIAVAGSMMTMSMTNNTIWYNTNPYMVKMLRFNDATCGKRQCPFQTIDVGTVLIVL